MEADSWHFSWDRGRGEVSSLGAMLAPVEFSLEDGRTVQPFAIGPWGNDRSAAHDALPGVLKRLRGEWACVPFGMPEPLESLPADWRPGPGSAPSWPEAFHGHSSNLPWRLSQHFANGLRLELDYPDGHPVSRVVRTVFGLAGTPALELSLTVHVRQACELPLGLHPTFRLPETPGSATLSFDAPVRAWSYPVPAEPGVSRLVSDTRGAPLDAVPASDRAPIDLTRHPLPFSTEELVLVTGHQGHATLANEPEGYAVRLSWDRAAFPACNLWVSNGGRQAYPWNGRFRALGIEPVVAPFDLGIAVANTPSTPLRAAGVPTTRQFAAGETWTTSYRIAVAAL